jgi:polysaccharide export outer membrane protein
MSRELTSHRRTFLLAGLSAVALGLGGCGSARRYPLAPAEAASTDHRYKIGPLDQLNIIVWRNAELSATVIVRPDGRISVPLVEDVLAKEVEQVLSRVVRDPSVTVIVTSFQGVYGDQIRIVGEATRPQAVPFRQNMTVLDVMIQAGGLTDFADGNAAVLVRGAEGGKQYGIRLKDLLKRGDISANVQVRPGDIIIVPQSWF